MSKKIDREERLKKYRLAVEDFYVDSYGNIKSISETIVKLLDQYPEKSIERLGACMWYTAISEIQVIFGDLVNEKHSLLSNRQRGYYASIRFCMETIADLEYLFLHPKELTNFMTDGDKIGQEISNLKKTCADEQEFDEKINKLLTKGKINSRVTERISKTLPGCLRDYALLCLYSHPSMEGFRLYIDQEGTFDLLFQKISYLTFRILASYYRILIQLNLLNPETDELFHSIVSWSLECYRRIMNIQTNYSKKKYRKDYMRDVVQLVKKWAHESQIK